MDYSKLSPAELLRSVDRTNLEVRALAVMLECQIEQNSRMWGAFMRARATWMGLPAGSQEAPGMANREVRALPAV
jgi:hypothetical protein